MIKQRQPEPKTVRAVLPSHRKNAPKRNANAYDAEGKSDRACAHARTHDSYLHSNSHSCTHIHIRIHIRVFARALALPFTFLTNSYLHALAHLHAHTRSKLHSVLKCAGILIIDVSGMKKTLRTESFFRVIKPCPTDP